MSETIRDDSVTIGTDSVEISTRAVPHERVELTIVNTSTAGQIISLAWGAPAVSGAGIVLYPSGTYSASQDITTVLPNLRISAVSNAVNGSIAIHERRILR